MTLSERINFQKGKEIPTRLKVNVNSENDEIDNYIITHTHIREAQAQEQWVTGTIQKIIEEEIKKYFK